jgi:hypothetical protein
MNLCNVNVTKCQVQQEIKRRSLQTMEKQPLKKKIIAREIRKKAKKKNK